MRRPLTLALLLVLPQTAAAAQLRDVTDELTAEGYGRIQGWAGAHLEYAQPEGELGRNIDRGFGLSGWFGVALDRRSRVSIGLELGCVNYSIHDRYISATPTLPWTWVDVTVTNNIITAGIPLRVEFGGGRVRPYATGSVGGARFFTSARLGGWTDEGSESHSMSSDLTFNWTAGGGMVFQIHDGERPLFLDLGLRHVDNGSVEYLTDRAIVNHGRTMLVLPVRSRANMTMVKVGVVVGLR